jgi:tetratricopeptide (TPR) repeat protein
MGRCYLGLGENNLAIEAFNRARDHDALAVRADSRINSIIRDAVAAFKGDNLKGVDAATLIADQIPSGIPGGETFFEHVHFTAMGNFRIARLLAGAVAPILPEHMAMKGQEREFTSEFKTCSDRLAFTLWDQKRVWNVALDRVAVPPFTEQSCYEGMTTYFVKQMRDIDSRTTRSSWSEVVNSYESALALNPDDTLIRWNFAQFLERNKAIDGAIRQGMEICTRLPHAPWPHYFVGSLMAKEGRVEEAVEFLRKALEIQPNLPRAGDELDQILAVYPSFR